MRTNEQPLKSENSLGFLRKQNKALMKELGRKQVEDGKYTELLSDISKRIEVIKAPKFQIPKKQKSKVESPVSAVLACSDWHIGEVIDGSEIEDMNKFNLEIAEHRVQTLTEKFIRWIELHQGTYNVNEIVVLGLGDLISNSIHEELMITNEVSPSLQVIKAGFLFSEMISTLSQRFERVRVEYVIPDNHSRTSKKPYYKKAGETSLNYIVGYIASERLKKIFNVEFNLHLASKQIVQIRNTNYLCCHGNGIKTWMSIPFYGINRLIGNEAMIRNCSHRTFSKMILGHFHVPLYADWFIINGSLSGTNEMDHQLGRSSKPCQIGFFVHPKWKEFDFTKFWF